MNKSQNVTTSLNNTVEKSLKPVEKIIFNEKSLSKIINPKQNRLFNKKAKDWYNVRFLFPYNFCIEC